MLAALVVLTGLAGCGQDDQVGQPGGVQRVLIVSLPGVAWNDVKDGDLPNLRAFAGQAAIGDLSTRIGTRDASTTDAYLSIGAGTRAIAPRVDPAVAVDPDERYGGLPSSEILLRRLGSVPTGVVYLSVGAAIERNERSSFGARPGRLGDLLADAGIGRAVIANADAAEGFVSDERPPDGSFARGAATALMGTDGLVPGGTVGRGLLMEDPLAPFGHRLDPTAVLDAFDETWGSGRAAVLVEASDLSRAAAYSPRARPEQRAGLRAEALASADRLLGALLERTDVRTDAVLVLSPVSVRSSPELAVAALRSPGVPAGMLRSSTTRRDGYVQLADVAPTILDLFDLPQPDEIEGRAFEVSATGSAGRIDRLVDEAAAAGFRDHLSPVVVPLVIAYLLVVLLLSLAAQRLTPRVARCIPALAVGALGVIPATFLAARVASVRGSTPGYLLVVVGLAAAFAGLVRVVERRHAGSAPIVAVAAVVLFFVGDVLAGAPLQLNSVFGYSVAVAGRFAGMGNLAFALFGAAAVVLAAMIVDRFGAAGLRPAFVCMGAIVLIEGLPFLGADVGGVLAMVPAFGVTAMALLGRRPAARHLVGLVIAGGLVVLVFAFIDQARPEGSRTHLARLAQHVVDGRWGPFFDSLGRRLHASFGNAEFAAWGALVLAVVVAGGYLAFVTVRRRRPDFLRAPGGDRAGPVRAARDGLLVLSVIGLVANDSSIAVPATMLIVAVPALVLLRERERSGAEVAP